MSDIYSTLQVSPKKRRQPSPDHTPFTPKKLRAVPLTPSSISRSVKAPGASPHANKLPDDLTRLCAIHNSLQRAISHALATCAVSPTSDSGHLRNVVNHVSLKTYSGLSSTFETEDLKRLCWFWEWDGSRPGHNSVDKGKEKEDNPFLDESSPASEDWTRGGMGFLVTPTTHLSKQTRQRIPAYGVGIEIEIDIDKGMDSGMAAVARWTSEADSRQKEFKQKVGQWNKLYETCDVIPAIPLADLPMLPIKASSLTLKLASASPKGLGPKSIFLPPASPDNSPKKSPMKKGAPMLGIPFPTLSSATSPTRKSSTLFPQTPRHKYIETFTTPITPRTPSNGASTDLSGIEGPPETPTKQTGSSAETAPANPSTSKRQALYERIRQKSLTASPTKSTGSPRVSNSSLTRDQMLKLSQEETRKRCLLGRLDRVAESVWMKFSAPTSGSLATPGRKRRALPASEVAIAVVQSSHVPISAAEANESLALLVKLCPFFLKRLDIQGEEWLEMPALSSNTLGTNSCGTNSVNTTPSKRGLVPPASPGSKIDSAELIHRSPKRVKKEAGGLREVREIIRRELELQD